MMTEGLRGLRPDLRRRILSAPRRGQRWPRRRPRGRGSPPPGPDPRSRRTRGGAGLKSRRLTGSETSVRGDRRRRAVRGRRAGHHPDQPRERGPPASRPCEAPRPRASAPARGNRATTKRRSRRAGVKNAPWSEETTLPGVLRAHGTSRPFPTRSRESIAKAPRPHVNVPKILPQSPWRLGASAIPTLSSAACAGYRGHRFANVAGRLPRQMPAGVVPALREPLIFPSVASSWLRVRRALRGRDALRRRRARRLGAHHGPQRGSRGSLHARPRASPDPGVPKVRESGRCAAPRDGDQTPGSPREAGGHRVAAKALGARAGLRATCRAPPEVHPVQRSPREVGRRSLLADGAKLLSCQSLFQDPRQLLRLQVELCANLFCAQAVLAATQQRNDNLEHLRDVLRGAARQPSGRRGPACSSRCGCGLGSSDTLQSMWDRYSRRSGCRRVLRGEPRTASTMEATNDVASSEIRLIEVGWP